MLNHLTKPVCFLKLRVPKVTDLLCVSEIQSFNGFFVVCVGGFLLS